MSARATLRRCAWWGALSLALAPVATAQDQAALKVRIVDVDATRYPTLEVRFKVIDTVPSTGFYDLKAAPSALAVGEAAAGAADFSACADVAMQEPAILPMALTLAVDRSNSVRGIIDRIAQATVDWVGGLDPGDQAAFVFFAGPQDLSRLLFQEATSDKATLTGFAQQHLQDTDSGTPLYHGWHLALGALDGISEGEWPARGVITLTDGKEVPHPSPEQVAANVGSIVAVSRSLDAPVFNIGFPSGGRDGGEASVCPVEMTAIADGSGGAFFQPTPGADDATYQEQVKNLFVKIRTSLKTVYRLTCTVPAEELAGQPRDLRLTVSYQASVDGGSVQLEGAATARYHVPLVAREDQPEELTSSPGAGADGGPDLLGGASPPRGGAWTGPAAAAFAVDLMARGDDGAPLLLATRDRDGRVTDRRPADSPFGSVPFEELTTYFAGFDLRERGFAEASSTLTLEVRARLPTCRAPDHDRPRAALPEANPEGLGLRGQVLFYRVQPDVERPYSFTRLTPVAAGSGVSIVSRPEVAAVRRRLPALVVFVPDQTPPTLAFYASPRRGEVGRVESLELPLDAAAQDGERPCTLALSGLGWTDDLSTPLVRAPIARPVARTAVEDWPLAGGGVSSAGLFVRQHVRLHVRLLAQDNFDRSAGAAYLVDGGGAAHDRFTDADALRVPEDGRPWPFLSDAAVSLRLVRDGAEEPVGDEVIFRQANVPEGEPVHFVVRAEDRSGNVTEVLVPVHVLPEALCVRPLALDSRRDH